MNEQEIINAIRDFMRESGITQERAAEMSGLKQNNISRMLAGTYTPNLKTLVRLTKAIGMRIVIQKW